MKEVILFLKLLENILQVMNIYIYIYLNACFNLTSELNQIGQR